MSSVGRSTGPMVVQARLSAAPLVVAVERVVRTGPPTRPGSRVAS